jgi:hypothetical protein
MISEFTEIPSDLLLPPLGTRRLGWPITNHHRETNDDDSQDRDT